jgi:hypothetical protein
MIPRLSENSPLMVMEGIYRNKDRCGTGESYTAKFFGHCVDGDQHFWGRPNGIFKGVHFGDFKLTKSSVQQLGDEGLPEAILEPLESLKWQEFDTELEFLAAVEAHIGKQQTVTYQEKILNAAVNHDGYKVLVANRRAFTAYLYSLIEPFIHPYYAAIIVNGTFFYLILLSGYTLAKYLNLHNTIIFVYPIVLSAHHRLLLWALETAFYTPKLAFSFFILVFGYKLQIFSKSASLINKLLFCAVLACSALVYDPQINMGFIFLWGFFYAVSQVKAHRIRAGLTLLLVIVYVIVPLIAQEAFEALLQYYDLAGNVGEHANAAEDLVSQLPLVPSFVVHNFLTTISKISDDLVKLIVYNPLSEEYLKIFGVFGLLCFFSILPKYIKGTDLKGIYALYLSPVLIQSTASFVAQIPPATYAWLAWTGPQRSGSHLFVLALAQCIGLYHIAQFVCRWMPAWFKPKYLIYCTVLFIYIFSYHKLLSLYS